MPFYHNRHGLRLHYEWENRDAPGTPILLLHGLGQSTASWRLLCDNLPGEHPRLLVDTRGHGQSDSSPGEYALREVSEDLIDLLNQLQLVRVHVIGLSMGGMLAFDLAAIFPRRVASFTVINSGPAVPNKLPVKLLYWQRSRAINKHGLSFLANKIAANLFRVDNSEPLQELYLQDVAKISEEDYLKALRSFIGWSVARHLPHINIPALIIAADQDYTPVKAKEKYVALMPRARLEVIANSGHGTPLEHPKQVAALFGQLLAEA